jgi:ATP-dependent DNA helicase RecG
LPIAHGPAAWRIPEEAPVTDEELADLVSQIRRYGTDLEFVEAKKAETALPKRLWETLSAFANQPDGGIIILGLEEGRGFATNGVRDPGKIQADLASMCREMEPPLCPLIGIHDFEGKQLVVAEIPEVPLEQKPCYYRGSGLYSGSFLRVGDGDRQMSQYEVHSFLESRGQPTHDLDAVPGVTRDDLDPALLQKLFVRVRERRAKFASLSDEEILRNLNVLDSEGRVTLAGVLCFAKLPQRWFPSLVITFVHYPGVQAGEPGPRGERFIDNRRFDGPLPQALDDALQAVVGSMRKRSLIQGLIREEIPEYPPRAVREALVNAVGHRDYSAPARGTQVQIQLFPNRLEIHNPGGLFGLVNAENLGEPGVQATRNQYLMQLLEDLGPAENRGSGIPTILRETRQAQMSPPEMRDQRTSFRIIFPNDSMLDEATVEWLNRLGDQGLSQNQRLALAYTLHQQEITNAIFCRLTGADSRVATAELRDLVARGLLEQEGSRRWTTYRLSPRAAESEEEYAGTGTGTRGRLSAAERQERILEMLAERGSVPARTLAEELGVPRPTINYDLRKLSEAGQVERTTADPKDKRAEYRLPGSS